MKYSSNITGRSFLKKFKSWSFCCRIYGAFTLETIMATAFGRLVEIQKGESDQLAKEAAIIFETFHEDSIASPWFIFTMLSKRNESHDLTSFVSAP